MKKAKVFDVVIVGGGPAGLALAQSLGKLGRTVCVLEKESTRVLANPPNDGREIAHTHASMKILKELGALKRVPKRSIGTIKEAKILDGTSPYFLNFLPAEAAQGTLGYIISNCAIRKALFETVRTNSHVTLVTQADVKAVETNDAHATVTLANGQNYQAALVVAADGRFSPCRQMMGIPVSRRDFDRTVIVCAVQHTKPHHNIAYECFHYERTLAVLPLPGQRSSVVITLPSRDAKTVLAMPRTRFNHDLEERFTLRHGAMQLQGERHAYPLVAVYAQSFIAERFALLGDAAVGMHPVTAHGFNFGLKGVASLTEEIGRAMRLGLDSGSGTVLENYNRRHRASTLPLYWGTNALVSMYTDDRPGAKIMRRLALRFSNNMPPIKKYVSDYLSDVA